MKDDIFRKNIGNRIKQLRKEHGLTQQELADKFNLAKSSIASYEGGTRMPNYEMLINMSTYFNCSMDYLMGLTSVKSSKEASTEEEKANIVETINQNKRASIEQSEMFIRSNQAKDNMVNLILGVFQNQNTAISAREALEILDEAKSKIIDIAYIYYN